MIFVVADREHHRLTEMTALLLSAFPGSTVYQHTSLTHATGDVLHRHVDALFALGEQNDGAEVIRLLQKKKPELPVLLLSDLKEIGYGHLLQRDVGQKLRSMLPSGRAAASPSQVGNSA